MKKYLLLSILGAATINSYAVTYPSSSANCTSSDSLGTCILNQPDGGSVFVAQDGLVASLATFTINKGLALRASTGYHPVFKNATFNITLPANKTFSISGFEMQKATLINATIASGSTINIVNNNWSDPSSTSGQEEGIRIASSVSSGSTATANIKGNNVVGVNNSTGYGLVDIYLNGTGLLKANIHDNHIKVNDLDAASREALYFFNGSTGNLEAQVIANEVRGAASQIRLRQNFAGFTKVGIVSNLLTGVLDKNTVINTNANNSAILSSIIDGGFKAVIGNNTIDGVMRSGTADGYGLNFQGHTTSAGQNSFTFLNNIIVNTVLGYAGPSTGSLTSTTSTGNNLFFNHGTISGMTLIGSDVNAPPEFIEPGVNYALKESSIAVDRSGTFGTALAYAVSYMSGYPEIDADGLRRFKGPGTDAGAYEWGDRQIFTQADIPPAHVMPINDSILDADANAFPLTTPMWNYPVVDSINTYNNHAIGVYRSSNIWRIFNQDFITMPNHAKFHVFQPYGEAADMNNNLQVYTSTTNTDTTLQLANIPSDASKIVIAKNYWTSEYNPTSVEVGYKNDNKWYVGNVNNSPIQTNVKFMTYFQDASRNAFVHYADAKNTSGHETTLDHPLLNGNPCAMPTVTQATPWLFGPLFGQNPHHIGVYYSGGRWRIFNQDFAAMTITVGTTTATGGAFNVVVDPQQVYTCNDIIFKHGFE